MGTPNFAKEVLQTLIENEYEIIAVVTQPDKPVGRKQILTPSEVKVLAIENNIPVIQPVKIRNEYQQILDLKPEMIITCAYGQIIPNAILDYCLCINVHGSLLPKYRGGAPMQRAILNGDKETGITIMTMSDKMDAGDIILQDSVTIEESDTLKTVEEKMIKCACPLLLKTLEDIEKGTAVFTKQNEDEIVFAPIIKKEEELLSFENENYDNLYNHIRALIDAPYAYGITCDNLKLKICAIRKSQETTEEKDGTIIGLIDKGIAVAKDKKILLLDEVLLEGKNKNTAKEFLNGAGRKYIGTVLR